MNNINYQLELDKIINGLKDVPRLLLHSCCAPCSSYCIEYLSQYFDVTVFYYNPNISKSEEYQKRVAEQIRLIKTMPTKNKVSYIIEDYEPREFFDAVKGLEHCREGGERCFACYELRLDRTARAAVQGGFDYFSTTLTISPLKNSSRLNEIGLGLQNRYGVKYLVSDFKKRNGYKRSIELSREYNLYRQDYCGCIYSYEERMSSCNK
ncbi:MAG: epoxyqueuosine reductase QueH [Lachnospiraceae bacterium]